MLLMVTSPASCSPAASLGCSSLFHSGWPSGCSSHSPSCFMVSSPSTTRSASGTARFTMRPSSLGATWIALDSSVSAPLRFSDLLRLFIFFTARLSVSPFFRRLEVRLTTSSWMK